MADDRHLMTVDDLYQFIKIEDPQVSPDGEWIAYVRVTIDKMENTYRRSIWLVPTGEGEPRQLTRGKADMSPRWSPTGDQLAFVSARGDKPQIYLLGLSALAGEARQLTSLPHGAVNPTWSPDGTQIAFLSTSTEAERDDEDADDQEEAPPADALDAKHRKERKDHDEKERQDPYRVWRIPYRSGTAFLDERYAQVYVIDTAEADETKPRRLTHVNASYSTLEWSVDGASLFSTRQIDLTRDEPFVDSGLFRIQIEDATETAIKVPDYTCFGPTPSPDGQWLAFMRLPSGKKGDLEAIPRLAVVPLAGGEITDLNLTFDRAINGFEWMADSKSLIFTAPKDGTVVAYRVPVEGGDVTPLVTGALKLTAFDLADDGGIAAAVSTPANPNELMWLPAGAAEFQPKTQDNAAWLAERQIAETHDLSFQSPSGKTIQGWYLLPPDYEAGKQYPLALNIHGGPRFMWGPSEETMFHEWQAHAARGYVVFYCNPRGSDGYGEAFQRDLHGAWGEVAMADIMAGVDELLKLGFVDPDRMAITGGSYGGYMTAWIVSHTDRFKSAVAQRGVYNLISFYGTSDVPVLISSDYGVEPWEDHAELWKHSPVAYADQIKTPLLIIHAENDYRVPIEQGEQLFAWVRRATDTPVVLIRYPRDGHELSRSGEPKHRISRLERMIDWFDQYTQ
jgi:dipeptidyl aminopeptidase/acylaminoacyl peptidase